MSQKRKILVTSALPYANGSIHIGHLVEYIQTDIWVRFQKLRGNECIYICADDTHGTPIMISARNQGISPEELIQRMHGEHLADFTTFQIQFDNYYTTHSEENRQLSEEFYHSAKNKGLIDEKEIEQYYCPKDAMFLPDRFIKGQCPNCGAEDQYGDSCEKCGTTYSPTSLKNPRCAVCGTPPVLKTTVHYFFKLSQVADQVKDWVNGDNHVRPEIRNKLEEWFKEGIRDWDISRDAPYFGFPIPGAKDKYFYVWLDAPVGYISSTENWAVKHNRQVNDIWKHHQFEIHHFIGKDILYFHTLFWPAMLMVGGYTLPSKVNVHGFLTVNGEKMSKSRGTFIKAKDFAARVNPEFLRYYYASKLSDTLEDIDLNLEDFVYKINSDVLGKVINIGSRLGSILTKKLTGKLTTPDEDGNRLLAELSARQEEIAQLYDQLKFQKAMRDIMALADKANKYIDEKAPWELVASDPEKAVQVCTTGLNAFKILMAYLKPVLPGITAGAEGFLNISPLTWENATELLHDHAVNPYEHLAKRLDPAVVTSLLTV